MMARKPKVFLGVGHGGWETGAYANGIKEKDANLTTALACNEVLVRHGVDTLMSRTTDEEDTLRQEINECNAFDPDLAVDMHHNAGKGDGVEVFHSVVGGTGKELAKKIHDEIVALGQNSRGVKTRKEDNGSDWYGFIRETKAPAVIVEYAFLDNDKDVQFVDTEAEQKANGVATAKGILKQLGIAYVPETEEADKQIVLGEFKTLREADDYLGALLAKLDYAMAQADLAKLAAADVKNELLKAKVVG
jgi:N-acetylmuramoyl-L-alanine amidase